MNRLSKRKFRCPKCGNISEIYPPDNIYTAASLDEPKPEYTIGNVKKRIIDCSNCYTPIALYWYRELIGTRILS